MEAISTRELKERLEELTGQEVLLRGWIRNHRKQKNMGFIDFFDGTCFKNPQVVYDSTLADYAAVQAYHVGSAIEVRGKVVPAYKDIHQQMAKDANSSYRGQQHESHHG